MVALSIVRRYESGFYIATPTLSTFASFASVLASATIGKLFGSDGDNC